MQNAIKRDRHRNFIQFLIPVILLVAPGILFAQSRVVLVSMASQTDALYWSYGEMQIADELRMSRLNVITENGSPYATLNLQNELRRAADTNGADIAMLIYKTDYQNARFLLYAQGSGNNAQMYSQYDFSLSGADDAAEIVALKIAEVVQVAVNRAMEKTPTDLPKPSRPPMAPGLKLALGLAIAGGVAVGVGGVFHGRRQVHLEGMQRAEAYRNINRNPEKFEDGRYHYRKKFICGVGAAVGYSVGAILLTASGVLLSQHLWQNRGKNKLAVDLHATSMTWEF